MTISFLLSNRIVPVVKVQKINNNTKQNGTQKTIPALLQKNKWIA